MGLLKRISRLFITSGNKVVAQLEDKIECLNYEIDKKVKVYDKLKNQLDEVKGNKKHIENEINKLKDIIAKLDSASKKALRDNKEDLARESFGYMKSNKAKLQSYEETLVNLTCIEETLEKQVSILNNVIKDMRTQIDSLKIKADFSKTVKDVNNALNVNLKDLNMDELDRLKDEINKDFCVAEIKSENIEKYNENNLDKYLCDNDFEEYKNSLK